jgi:N-acetylglucosamine-6-sulfatase
VGGTTPSGSVELPANPNFVVVIVDDMRWDEFGAGGHPYVETPNIDRLAEEGAMFRNAFHAVSLCSPNRASLLTGQYPSQHGIVDNVARVGASFRLRTFPQALQEAGYATAFFGKWHMGNDPTPRPGFDAWAGLPGQGRSIDPELYEDGRLHVVEGYTTDILTDRAVAFIEEERDGPFMVYIAHKAIHPDVQQFDDGSVRTDTPHEYVPAPRHRGRYAGATWPRGPSSVSSLDALADRPALQRSLAERETSPVRPLYGDDAFVFTDEEIRDRAEMLLAVDEGLGRIMETLRARGELDRTVVILSSDNGFFFGEHGLTIERRLPYEESIRNAFLVRYPPVVTAGIRPEGLVSSIDLAPTVLELAGAPVGAHIQGRSVVPLLQGLDEDWRSSVLVEFYTYENPFPHLTEMDYRAIRTDRYKYVHWVRFPDGDELYDLELDPQERNNVIGDPAYAEIRSELRAELGRQVLGALGLGG